MNDLISRRAAIDALTGLKPDDDSDLWFDAGFYAALKGTKQELRLIPPALTEADLLELEHRYGKEVRATVEDMISGKGERWAI